MGTELAAIASTVQTTHEWLNELTVLLGWPDRHDAYQALRGVLHALRDRLSVDEAAALGAQLPMLVRGCYYEDWHPHGKPLKERKKGGVPGPRPRGRPAGAGLRRRASGPGGVSTPGRPRQRRRDRQGEEQSAC